MQFKNEPNGWVCPYFTHNWVETTRHFLRVYTVKKYFPDFLITFLLRQINLNNLCSSDKIIFWVSGD